MIEHFCMYQRDIKSFNDDDKNNCRGVCTYTEKHHAHTYLCPFLVKDHAEFICHLYIPIPKKLTVDECLSKLEHAMKCLQEILKG